MQDPKTDYSQLCIHTITNKPWQLEEALENYCAQGIGGVSIWQNIVEQNGAKETASILEQYPIKIVSYVRGGFFAHPHQVERYKAIEENKRLLEEAAIIGAPLIVLVCGAHPQQPLEVSREQILKGIEAILPLAESLNIKLGIEPLHPMYAHSRSAINTLKQANDLAEKLDNSFIGVVVDVYHVWWEPNLKNEIKRCGSHDNLLAYHICDWKSPQKDFLNDRGLMGDGCINIKAISAWVKEAGFNGFHEVEIFSQSYWSMDQSKFLNKILERYEKLY